MNRTLFSQLSMGSALLALTLAVPQLAGAQESEDTLSRLETVVVTAGRREQPISDVQASVEVIGPQDIATFSGASLTEVLRQSVGVDARTSGANSTISVRGQVPNAGSAVLILFDGLPRTGKFGSVNLNNFGVEDVERIEIIRGPMSALYGADASGGVINIITKPAGEGAPLSARITAGTVASSKGKGRETLNLAATGNLKTGNVGHRFSVDWRDADPYRYDDTIGEDDLSALDHLSLSYTGEVPTGETGRLHWTAEGYFQDDIAAAQTRTREAYNRFEKEDRYFGAAGYEVDLAGGSLSIQGSYGYSDASVNRSYPAPDETTEFTQTYAQASYVRSFGDHHILVGGGAQRDEIDLTILTETGESENVFAFAQDDWNIADDIKMVAGLRLDDFDSFGTQLVPRISIGSRGQGVTWRLGYGQAYRAPSVIERYGSFIRGGRTLILGTPDIDPEDSETWEAAIGWRSNRMTAELVYHDSEITNLIAANSTGEVQNGLFITRYQNIDHADISGVEVSTTALLERGFSVDGSFEYLDAVDGETGDRLTGRAKNTLKVALNWEGDNWGTVLRARRLGDFWASDPNVRGSDPYATDYTVADMQVRYEFNDTIGISVGVDNIFDELTPINWSGTGQIEDPAGRYTYISLRYVLGESDE